MCGVVCGVCGVWRGGVCSWHGEGSQSPRRPGSAGASQCKYRAASTAIEASLCPRSSGSRATADACWERGCPSTGFAGEQLVDRALFHDAPGPIAADNFCVNAFAPLEDRGLFGFYMDPPWMIVLSTRRDRGGVGDALPARLRAAAQTMDTKRSTRYAAYY